MITCLTPIDIKIEETARLFQITKGNIIEEVQFDHDTRTKHWLHPAISFTILDDCKEDDSTIHIYTDGSKNEQGVGAGAALFITGKHTSSLQYRLNKRCTNNQSEQVVILKSLEHLQTINMAAKMVTIYTDSQTTLDSIKNLRIHTYIQVYIHTYKHTNTYIHTHIHKYTHTYKHTHIHTYIHAYKHTYLHIYVHTYTQTYIHTYVRTYIQTYLHTYKHA